MFVVLVVLAIEVLVAFCGVSLYFIWPFEEWLMPNFLQNLLYRFSEHNIDCLNISRSRLPSEISLRPVVIVSVRPEIPPLVRDNLLFSFPLLLVFLNHFILINPVYSWRTLVMSFPVRDFLKLYLAGRPILKVLMATLLKSPFISLNISQYLSEYVFRVSPSRMLNDSREAKGRETLLQVTNWEPNAW